MSPETWAEKNLIEKSQAYAEFIMKETTLTKEQAYEQLGLMAPTDEVKILTYGPSEPKPPNTGDIKKTTDGKLFTYDGDTWIPVGAGTVSADVVDAEEGGKKFTSWVHAHALAQGEWQITPMPPEVPGGKVMDDLGWLLPGLTETVDCPAYGTENHGRCPGSAAVAHVVQHLNDHTGWTREQIADWLDTLDVDLTFPIEPPPKPVRRSSRHSTYWSGGYENGGGVGYSVTIDYAPVDMAAAWKSFSQSAGKSALAFSHLQSYFDEILGFTKSKWKEPEPEPYNGWAYGAFPECPTTPELPAYDTLRAETNDVAPDLLANQGLAVEKRQVDYSQFNNSGTAGPARQKRKFRYDV